LTTSRGAVSTAPDIPPIAPARKGTHVFEGMTTPPTLRRGGTEGVVRGTESELGSSVMSDIYFLKQLRQHQRSRRGDRGGDCCVWIFF